MTSPRQAESIKDQKQRPNLIEVMQSNKFISLLASPYITEMNYLLSDRQSLVLTQSFSVRLPRHASALLKSSQASHGTAQINSDAVAPWRQQLLALSAALMITPLLMLFFSLLKGTVGHLSMPTATPPSSAIVVRVPWACRKGLNTVFILIVGLSLRQPCRFLSPPMSKLNSEFRQRCRVPMN